MRRIKMNTNQYNRIIRGASGSKNRMIAKKMRDQSRKDRKGVRKI
jgi:hypothetical protein